ncbi:MAG: class I tRNA ligase family protein, partial [Bacilli bacterium]|nr:class I tRNA ligase family protein [Bacilli bacterium]
MELKDSLLMMNTGFEMRGNLAQKEPVLVKKWQEEDLYALMNENRAGCEEYVLHDGPPYANGDMHCGHMLNRLLKDFVIRYKNMAGYRTPFVFGWDTHGLPIETQVTKSGVDRKKTPLPEFRDICKNYALGQVAHQKEQIRRLGVVGDFDHPYLTLLPEYEARQIEVFANMALQGLIFKGMKPVYWSPSSESALAEAEIEYHDVPAKTMYVAFDVVDGKGKLPQDAKVVIWTTTPWTIPANLAVTANPRFEYGLYQTNLGKLL